MFCCPLPMSRIPPAVIDEVLDRAYGHCEACGHPERGKMDFHHRKRRAQGGADEVDNLIWVHHDCHVITPWSIHQNPARSYHLGHMLRSGEEPQTVPVITRWDLKIMPKKGPWS